MYRKGYSLVPNVPREIRPRRYDQVIYYIKFLKFDNEQSDDYLSKAHIYKSKGRTEAAERQIALIDSFKNQPEIISRNVICDSIETALVESAI